MLINEAPRFFEVYGGKPSANLCEADCLGLSEYIHQVPSAHDEGKQKKADQ